MARIATNKFLHKAKSEKNDEFYTILADIERELKHYKRHFKNKVVLCNCDDPRVSNFFHYFSYNFEQLGLKKLIATCYKNQDADLFSQHKSEKAIYLEYTGDKNKNNIPDSEEIGIKHLKGDGDFRSEECIELLKQADIVVTNPPFSLFREYVVQLAEYRKKFLIVGTWNVITYKDIFHLIKEDKLWIGINSNRNFSGFIVPKHYSLYGTEARIDENGNRIVSSNNTCWFTNLDTSKRHEELILYKTFNRKEYSKYDNYDAIEVGNTKDIPIDYDGCMGIRQEFLQTAIDWISGGKIEDYMSKHQHDKNAKVLWEYFQAVIDWVKTVFPNYRKEMKGVPFGFLYNEFKGKKPDAKKLEKEIAKLMEDEDVTNKKGIYSYVLNGKEKFLNIRAFTENQKREAFERQKGVCPDCKKKWKIEEMEADHITPWHEGGKTKAENCKMRCKEDNRRKSGK